MNPTSQLWHSPVCGWQVSPWRQRGHGQVQFSPYSPCGQGCLQWVPFQPGSQARQAPSVGEHGSRLLQWPQLRGQRGTERRAVSGLTGEPHTWTWLFSQPAQPALAWPLLGHRLLTCGHTGVRRSRQGRAPCSSGLCSHRRRCSVHLGVHTCHADTGMGVGRPPPTILPRTHIGRTPGCMGSHCSCRKRRIACPTSPDGTDSVPSPDRSGSQRDCTGTASDSQGPTSPARTGRSL